MNTHGNSLPLQVDGPTAVNVAQEHLPHSGTVGIFKGGDLSQVPLDWLRIDTSR